MRRGAAQFPPAAELQAIKFMHGRYSRTAAPMSHLELVEATGSTGHCGPYSLTTLSVSLDDESFPQTPPTPRPCGHLRVTALEPGTGSTPAQS